MKKCASCEKDKCICKKIVSDLKLWVKEINEDTDLISKKYEKCIKWITNTCENEIFLGEYD